MQEQNKRDNSSRQNMKTAPGHGPQGIDKAPGEEGSQDNVQFTQQSQKGKKVDADPEKEEDRPLSEQDL
jgi:hypothetical protein